MEKGRNTTRNQYIICTFLSGVELRLCCHGDVIYFSKEAVLLGFKLHCNVGGGWREGALDCTVIRDSLRRSL